VSFAGSILDDRPPSHHIDNDPVDDQHPRYPGGMAPIELTEAIRSRLQELGVAAPADLKLERPRNPDHGDWAVNCFPLAKGSSYAGPQLAAALADSLDADPPVHLAKAEAVGGFLNLRLHPTWLHDVLRTVVAAGPDTYASADLGRGHSVDIEYVSANPTGPLHAAHGRWAAYGDSLARVMARCGYAVQREFYINDRGGQLDRFGASLLAAKRGEPVPEDGYRGAYVEEWAAEMPDDVDPVLWGRDRALADQRETLAEMGVYFDHWTSERAIVAAGAMEQTLEELRQLGHVYDADGAVWLRTTDFGDDRDRVLVRSNGDPTYLLPDIANHRHKFTLAEHLIDVLGPDHHGYLQRIWAGIEALHHRREDLEIIVGQNVVLLRNGEEVKLSKRRGDIILLREDVIDEVGPDATRFTYLLQSVDTKLVFDLDVVIQRSMDNPVFYVQMAHARLAGIARNAAAKGIERQPLDTVDLGVLGHQREHDILTQLSDLPTVVRDACERRAPNKVVTWSREMAAAVHGFHHDCWVVADDVPPELTQARLWLVEAARIGLVVALDLVGVTAPEQM
jgi:arginyl-tRNA synthetase